MMTTPKKKTKGSPDLIDKHVGNRLRVRRSLVGLSQEKLAEAISLTSQQIQKYEKGLNRISAGRLFEFSRILDVPVTYFYDKLSSEHSSEKHIFGMADNDQEDFAGNDLTQSKESLNLLRAYYRFKDPSVRKEVYKFIRTMADQADKN